MSETYEKNNQYSLALFHYKQRNKYHDSLMTQESSRHVAEMQAKYDAEKKQKALELLSAQNQLQAVQIKQNQYLVGGALSGIVFLGAVAFALYRNNKIKQRLNIALEERNKALAHASEAIQKQNEKLESINRELQEQRSLSDKLLLNIMPLSVAVELKKKGKFTPRNYDLATVLFTDFKGFTQIGERLTPQEIVEELEFCFVAFDEIVERYNLEKIKTLGDRYMCAGGLPTRNTTNPVDAILAALAWLSLQMNLAKSKKPKENKVGKLESASIPALL